MKFVISGSELLGRLQATSRVISTKNTLPILDNFLFSLKGKELTLTASDLETTLTTSLTVENSDGNGDKALPARVVLDTVKGLSKEVLVFDINMETLNVTIKSENGTYNIVGQMAVDFPKPPALKSEKSFKLNMPCNALLQGITKTIFATAQEELRPVMGGIFIDATTDNISFVASDAHKLVRYTRMDAKAEKDCSFIMPKKPAGILKNLLTKEEGEVRVEFDDKNAFVSLEGYNIVCRLVEGTFPNYKAVIPKENNVKITVDRADMMNSLKRVSLFSNQQTNLVKLLFKEKDATISAQDMDFSISAYEKIVCDYKGEEFQIGFKSTFLMELLSNMTSKDVRIELSDPTRAGLILPTDSSETDDLLMLLMPMMIQ